jgi:hypothetical protein
MRMGQILGSTNRWGEEPRTRPVHFRDVFAAAASFVPSPKAASFATGSPRQPGSVCFAPSPRAASFATGSPWRPGTVCFRLAEP